MHHVRIAALMCAACLLLSGCTHVGYDPTVLPPESRIGAWTLIRPANFPERFRDAIASEFTHVEERAGLFQTNVDRNWHGPNRLEHLTLTGQQRIDGLADSEFMAIAESSGLKAFMVFQVDYVLGQDPNGFVFQLKITGEMTGVEDGKKLWYKSVSETGTPVNLPAVQRGALAQQYSHLVKRGVKRLLKGM